MHSLRKKEGAEHSILIVDDERDNLEFMHRCLRSRGTAIHLAEDGEEALSVMDRHPVNLIVTDQRMPKLRGTDFLRLAKERYPDAVRVLVTACNDVKTFTDAINDGHTYRVISKPLQAELLRTVVQSALEAYEAAARERELFESFVLASVTAIEQRDPTTAGHSLRVAALTMELARVVDGITEGPFATTTFSRDDVEQIRYASLLHDFGKIGVRESVLVKANKLPELRHEILKLRVKHAKKLGQLTELEGQRAIAYLTLLNDPGTPSSRHRAELQFLSGTGLLDEVDMNFLCIERGSLSEEERIDIQRHVEGTIHFLGQLPWPDRFSRVARIAGAHHERLDGSGYPTGVREIPVEAQMMAICDIYDALVARDRPYKPAVPHERALKILSSMAQDGQLSQVLLDYFIARSVHESAEI